MRKNKYLARKIIFFTSIILILTIISLTVFIKIKPLVYTHAQGTAEAILLNAASEAVVTVLEQNDITYASVANLSRDADGYVTSLEIDISKINLLKNKISNEISRIIAEKEDYDIAIPLGTFFGSEYTVGLGPKIHFNMQMTARAVVEFENEFLSAGINQVLHKIMINIELKANIIMIGYTSGFTATTNTIAAQTVIVGITPDAYTQVNEEAGSDIAGIVNDYGAY